ncbi:MauE/DoxX family redox-associated membrane protein [Sphaerimonospora cavernae]|uniref:MauE/DoxX family redox-associated membrane protein n=1 Tax=Sphaerimonospora cavernae TaxID=1740611 RepID=A0ABV6UBH7_9ACTN
MIYLVLVSRMLLTAVFVLSALGKVRNLDAFAEALAQLKEVPKRLTGKVALLVVAAEITVALLLVVTSQAGLISAAVLLLAFTTVIMRAISRRRRVSCNCFGKQGASIGERHLVRNALLVLIALLGAVGEMFSSGSFDLPGIAMAGTVTAALTILIYFWDELVDLVVPLR